MSARSIFETLERRRLFAGQPVLYVSDTWVAEGNDGTSTASVVVSLSQSRPHQSVTVNYSTQNGTAVAGTDYRAASGKLTFAPGETSETIPVAIIGDRVVGADGYFLVNLQSPKQARIGDGQAVVSISDDEPRIYVGDVYAAEGNSGTTPFVFTVSLSVAYDRPVTVDYATADGSAAAGSDYAAAAGTVTFAPGETTQTVTVQVNGDRLVEGDESFSLDLGNASSNSAIARGVGYGSIVDDEPQISIWDAVNYWGDTSPFTFTVVLSAASEDVVTVDFATADGTAVAGVDYAATSGTITFLPGETSKTFTVEVLSADFADKYFFVNLGGATNAPVVDDQAIAYWYYDWGYYDGGGYYDPGYYW
jgi:large repetitive protein